jgi:hypothetical protein
VKFNKLAFCLVLLFAASTCFTQTFTSFDMPNSSGTEPAAINLFGGITGTYTDGLGRHGFLRKPNGTLISFDAPYQFLNVYPAFTSATSINAVGEITGYVVTLSTFRYHGFVRRADGTFVFFEDPDSCRSAGISTADNGLSALVASIPFGSMEGIAPVAINDAGQITGICGEWPPFNQSFLRQADGTLILIMAPVAIPQWTRAQAINLWGEVTGYFQDFSGHRSRGFVRGPLGKISMFDVGDSTQPAAINLLGQIAGSYSDEQGTHCFIRQPNGTIRTFDVPNAISAQPASINLGGQITGVYFDASNIAHGFLRDKDGTITTIDVPNAINTQPTGINARGDITGWYSDAGGVHGFVRR